MYSGKGFISWRRAAPQIIHPLLLQEASCGKKLSSLRSLHQAEEIGRGIPRQGYWHNTSPKSPKPRSFKKSKVTVRPAAFSHHLIKILQKSTLRKHSSCFGNTQEPSSPPLMHSRQITVCSLFLLFNLT